MSESNAHTPDDIELAFRAAPSRRCAGERSAKRPRRRSGLLQGHPKVLIRTGEGAVAARLAETFAALADELESGRPA
jgi:hypothetical protein